jgi:hydrogenase/urease accessory protein HupE
MSVKIFLFFILFVTEIVYAHQTGLSFVDIKEDDKKNISVVYKKPLEDTQAQDIQIRFPSKCMKVSEDKQTIEDGYVINNYILWCTDDGLAKSRIWVEGLVSSDRGVLLRYENGTSVEKSLLRATTPFMYIDKKSGNFELAVEYTNLGIMHIWSGFDHLLFVLALVLLAHSTKTLLYSITGFTLAHSITLAFGVLGIVNVGAAYVEAMIALSIVFLARELVVHNVNSLTRKKLGVIAFIFGLLHGFGFSSVLRSIGLPQNEIALSLFSFNLGIEIGQILFILLLSATLFMLKKYLKIDENITKKYLAYSIGIISSFWLIERVTLF